MVAYFCTPDLRILHAVWGPESPRQFLAEAQWAVELYRKLQALPAQERMKAAREAHQTNPYRLSKGGPWSAPYWEHRLRYDQLTTKVLAPLNESAAELFEKLVNERLSDEEVRVLDPEEDLSRCRVQRRQVRN